MKTPNLITFTGVDERTDLNRLVYLSHKYPVEWGILFSRTNQGRSNRYPNLVFVKKLITMSYLLTKRLRLSAHICGKYSNEIMEGGFENTGLINLIVGFFTRTQINIRDGETLVEGKLKIENAVKFANDIEVESAIIQCTGHFPNDDRIHWLSDKSGGAGISPNDWNCQEQGCDESVFCGYAGGIGPDNIVEVLDSIHNVRRGPNRPYWIDMEANVRDSNDWLDLDKCESVLKQVYPEL